MNDFANNILGNNFAAVQDATAHSQINDLIDNNDLVDIDEQMNSILSQQPPLEQTISEAPWHQTGEGQDILAGLTMSGAGTAGTLGKGKNVIQDILKRNKASVDNINLLNQTKARANINLTVQRLEV